MNKFDARNLLDFADACAMADVATKHGEYDPFDKTHGDLYWQSFIRKLAEKAPDMMLPDLLELADS